jgi:hypothetical protein
VLTASDESTSNDPSKIRPPIWLSLEDAFQQLRARSGLSREAANDLYGILCGGDCPSVWVSTGAWCPVSVGFWRDLASLLVVFNVVDGVDHLNVAYPDYAFDHLNYLSDDRGTFFLRAADFARELERLNPMPAAPPPGEPQFGAGETDENKTPRAASQHAKPGDSEPEGETRTYLYNRMTKFPRGDPDGQTKADHKKRCREEFGVSAKAFDRIWGDTIADTGATSYSASGPRGPHKSRIKSK